jgi:hypothetical protein
MGTYSTPLFHLQLYQLVKINGFPNDPKMLSGLFFYLFTSMADTVPPEFGNTS